MIEKSKILCRGLSLTDYIEKDLKLTVPDIFPSENFDGENHGLAHCMKAVDFIIEIPSHFLFVEFKDPDHPMSKEKDKIKFINSFKSGSIDSDLVQKYRDTWLYCNSIKKINDKPIMYIILIACKAISGPELLARTDELTRKLPRSGLNNQDWSWFVQGCMVFNIESWNKKFEKFPISRISLS